MRAWQGMYEGRLMEAVDGDTEQAIEWYQGLLGALSENDPLRPELQYWLGRALFSEGDQNAARTALAFAVEDVEVGDLARALLSRIEKSQKRITSLPLHHDFLESTEHWLRDWQHTSKGDIRVEPAPGGDSALAWYTRVTEREDDEISIVFDPKAVTPRVFKLSLRSSRFPSHILPVIYDSRGHRFSLETPIEVLVDSWSALDLNLKNFTLGEGRVQGVSAFVLQDVTAFYSTDRGPNVILLGDVVVE
jgi:hypothetical protein